MIVTDTLELSIVIVNYFSEAKLGPCLRSIDAQPVGVEVVVADNGSDPGNRDELRAAHPKLVWLEMAGNTGFATACNAGASASRSGKLLFLNPDTLVHDGALRALAGALESAPDADAILGCQIRNEDGARQLSCRRFPDWRTFLSGRFSLLTRLFPRNRWSVRYLMTDLASGRPQRVDWVSGAAMAMRRATFEQLSGFDESYFLYFEDVDLCRRGADGGIATFYFPGAVVMHQIGGSSGGIPYRSLAYRHRSMWTYYRRHLGHGLADPLAGLLILARLGMQCLGRVVAGNGRPRAAAGTGGADIGQVRGI